MMLSNQNIPLRAYTRERERGRRRRRGVPLTFDGERKRVHRCKRVTRVMKTVFVVQEGVAREIDKERERKNHSLSS